MTDIFFSYSSADRERVRPIRDALAEQGFEVFWDQQVPPGMDWDTWIRQHLTKSKCAMAFWSATSVSSDNVRHEAMVAKQQGKLISVLLEPLTAEQFPMGLYAQQAANLSGWSGDYSHDEWRKFRREFEAKLTPLWVRRQIDELEAELVGERSRREGVERRDRVLQAQIAKEVAAQQDLKEERDKALDEAAGLMATVEELTQARLDAEAREEGVQQASKQERDKVLNEAAGLKATIEKLTRARADAEASAAELSQRLRKVRQSKAQETARSIGAAFSPFVIALAVATVGFWTYQLIWSAPQPPPAVASGSTPEAEQQRLAAIKEEEQRQAKTADLEAKLKAAEAEQQRLKDEVQRQTKAAADVETKLKAAEAEQQRQTKAAADADGKRRAAEAEQQRLKDEVQRQTKAAADAEAKLKAATPATSSATDKSAALPQSTATNRLFEIRRDMEAQAKSRGEVGRTLDISLVRSMDECEQKCTQSASCDTFTLRKSSRVSGAAETQCYLYSGAELVPNSNFDSGVRK